MSERLHLMMDDHSSGADEAQIHAAVYGVTPSGGPPDELGAHLRSVRSNLVHPPDAQARWNHLAAMRKATAAPPRRTHVRGLIAVAAATVGLVGVTTGLAAADRLPQAAQNQVARLAEYVGVDLPGNEPSPAAGSGSEPGADSPRPAPVATRAKAATPPFVPLPPSKVGDAAGAERGPASGAGSPPRGSSPATDAPGRSGETPPQTGSTPGGAVVPPGQSGSGPGQSGSAPGDDGSAPGSSEQAPGRTGATPSQSNSSVAPGRTGETPGTPSVALGHTGEVPGHSGTTPAATAGARHVPPEPTDP
jgi:hypothetical protein